MAMKLFQFRTAICTISIVFTSPAAHSHHSAAALYDLSRVVTVEGSVSRYEWANPHVYVYLEQTTDFGDTIEWEIWALPPSVMRRLGWDRDSIAVGDSLGVSGHPARYRSGKSLFPLSIQRNGVTLYEQGDSIRRLSTPGGDPDAPARALDGTWETLLNLPLILSLVEPKFALTDKGATAAKNFDDATMNPAVDCIPHSAPLLMIDPDAKRIVTQGDVILIEGGYGGEVLRTVRLGAVDNDGASPSIQGHSVGRWEGRTLVIDTTHFADHRQGNTYSGVPSGEQKHLVERLTVNEDGKGLTYRFELSDPEYLLEPVTGEVQYRPGRDFEHYECSLENARRYLKP